VAANEAESSQEIRREILDWVRETRVLLEAAQAVVDWHGTEEESQSFIDSTMAAKEILRGMVGVASSRFMQDVKPASGTARFQCSVRTAAALSPLLEVLATPVPDFIGRARHELSADEAKRVTMGFGLFCGAMVDHVYERFWKDHPTLAPEGWPL
jgi:hypothetical protein